MNWSNIEILLIINTVHVQPLTLVRCTEHKPSRAKGSATWLQHSCLDTTLLQEKQAAGKQLDLAIKTTPWALTDNYVSRERENRGSQVAFAGPGDPTGKGRGFSFVKDTRRVRPVSHALHSNLTATEHCYFHSLPVTLRLWLLQCTQTGETLTHCQQLSADACMHRLSFINPHSAATMKQPCIKFFTRYAHASDSLLGSVFSHEQRLSSLL